ncbi:MAG: alpha/beta hydrolase, partial [Bacteroidales bacterium]|nr:alpha/beta hydrolase [Bacteroidales bacterium]
MHNPYFKHFLSLDMRPQLGDIKCPVLALNGTKDQQVEPNSNLKALRDALEGKNGSKVVAMEGLNHLFQHSTTGLMTEYRQIEETFAPEALDLIINWLKDLALP